MRACIAANKPARRVQTSLWWLDGGNYTQEQHQLSLAVMWPDW